MRKGSSKGKTRRRGQRQILFWKFLPKTTESALLEGGGVVAWVDFFTHMVTASQEVTYNSKIEGDVTVTRLDSAINWLRNKKRTEFGIRRRFSPWHKPPF